MSLQDKNRDRDGDSTAIELVFMATVHARDTVDASSYYVEHVSSHNLLSLPSTSHFF